MEQLSYPREYTIDSSHRYYHVLDRWGDPSCCVSPMNINMDTPIDEHFIQNNVSIYYSPRSELIKINTSNLNRLTVKYSQRRSDEDEDND